MTRTAIALMIVAFSTMPISAQPKPEDTEPSKVWGYVTARNPSGGVWLPGTSAPQSSGSKGSVDESREAVRLSNLTIVFRNEGGVEHKAEFSHNANVPGERVRTHYYKPGANVAGYLEGAIAIRYEVRFAHTIDFPGSTPRIAPDLVGGGASGIESPVGEPLQARPGSVYNSWESQWPHAMIAYDPTQWRFDRVEIGSLIWDGPEIGNSGTFPEYELTLSPEPVPIIELPDQPDM